MVAIPLTRNRQVQNRPFNHIGVSVANIEETVDWYKKVVGFQLIGKINTSSALRNQMMSFSKSTRKSSRGEARQRATGNGVGFELFQFIDPGLKAAGTFERQYQSGGFFHICVTDSDPEALAKIFKENGGKQVRRTVDPSGRARLYACTLRIFG